MMNVKNFVPLFMVIITGIYLILCLFDNSSNEIVQLDNNIRLSIWTVGLLIVLYLKDNNES